MLDPTDLGDLAPTADRMPPVVARFQADRDSIGRRHATPYSTRCWGRTRRFSANWLEALESLPFEDFSRSDRLDWLLLRNTLARELRRLDRGEARFAEMQPLVPFIPDLVALDDERRELGDTDPEAIAGRLAEAMQLVAETRAALQSKLDAGQPNAGARPAVANRAAEALDRVRKTLGDWFGFHFGYDPVFTWWVEKPYRALEESLKEYADFLRKRLAGVEDLDAIIGDPIGRDALIEELQDELIPYTPEELVTIACGEREWCAEEMIRAAGEMGCGDDWRAALERVKSDHVPPGAQPALVRDLAQEAIQYVEERDLVTVPGLARECWQMEMMSPEAQKVNPFFLGGETIIVSFPTSTMDHAQKQMSLRGNNRSFARATVQHELIPGHYLQAFCQERYRPYRRLFYTPFWVEGWALHWEMLLWDLGFPRTPEERVGMLFWRLHRCARVLFSLGFHLGDMTPQQCVDLLVDEVGHERENAVAEVRRSFGGEYDPLYQCAYLIGGLQVRSLHRELVGSGRMTQREFHDAVLRENTMPIAALRALLLGLPLERNFASDWRFA
jgi:hypothetical protein